jgi:hypothetical protein
VWVGLRAAATVRDGRRELLQCRELLQLSRAPLTIHPCDFRLSRRILPDCMDAEGEAPSASDVKDGVFTLVQKNPRIKKKFH